MMVEEVQPQSNVEWLWTLDLVELSWEFLRYRRLKQRALHEHRHCALPALCGLGPDPFGIPINLDDPSVEFSAWNYAEQRCEQIAKSR
jgi:hypothetical protein